MSDNSRCQLHGREICTECVVVSDAAKRAYDIVRAYAVFVPWDTRVRSFVALRLEDGGSDGVLYESKREAVRHQPHETMCAYFSYRNAPNGFANAREAQVYLDWHRAAYNRGHRLPDPDDQFGGPDAILPVTQEQFHDQIARMIQGSKR